ncbi:hypothetical protein J5N97_019160 [Dioscorea zingiberensis]|uniref:DUF7032 domain-containing protein n=1 Tax=Dioscorea zingiberensis TaxID=325984 RepID=A0A9D5CDI6_9LILI|nr:hypothetical protein J5N97_019160 [Dioscorea zingiberensis]
MKSPDARERLRLAGDLMASLTDTIPAVRCLRGRWFAVSATLDRLRAAVSCIAALPPDSLSHPLFSDLLKTLPETLALTLTLSLHCSSPEPPAGHLQTLSDLSSAAAELARLASDADLLLRSNTLIDSSSEAAGVSRRDAVRELVTRVQIGDAASRAASLEELVGAMEKDAKEVVVAAAEGAVPAVVRLLDSPCRETRDRAVEAIARFSAAEGCRPVLAGEGVLLLNHLARALESDASGPARESACVALQALTVTRDAAMAVGSRGAVGSLLTICVSGTPSSQAAAAGVLRNLAEVIELQEIFLEENAVPILIQLLSSGTILAKANAAACLCNLTSSQDAHGLKLLILKEGGLECLKDYLESGAVGDKDWDVNSTLRLLRNLLSFKYIGGIVTTMPGLVPLVLAMLDSRASSTRTEATKVVFELAYWAKVRKEMGHLGCVSRLVVMLEAKAYEEKEAAVMALAALMQCAGNRRLFRKEERGVVNVVMLLDPLLKNVDKKYVVSVLMLVSQSRRCRKKMVAAGACGYLQRLVDVEVEDAKVLLESLEKGKKLWGVFTTK